MTMNPSEYEIQLEVEALRDIRRRSITPGALTIDPDLPNQSASQNAYWSSPSTENDSSSSSSHEDSSSSSGHTDSPSHRRTDDPFHLFWVPASVHPEIAPAEFRAFLKEHSRSPPPADDSQPLSRSSSLSSVSSQGLGRKRSMLSRQYRPSENDDVEEKEEKIVPLRRNRSTLYHNQGPQLTINDLQRLEQLAEEASENDDPSRLRNVLRRSLSLNVSPTALDKMDRVPEMGDEADAPIIVPPPGLILRRAARTKIRKPSLPGDGDGHRFGSTRRRTSARAGVTEQRTSSDQGEQPEPLAHKRVQSLTESADTSHRPSHDSFDEALIYDAYARDDDEELHTQTPTSPPLPITTPSPPPPPPPVEITEVPKTSTSSTLPEPEVQPSLLEALGPIVHSPQPQRSLSPQPSSEPTPQQTTRTPSPPLPGSSAPLSAQITPPTPPPQQQPASQLPQQQPSFLNTPPTPQQLPPTRKEKDKKGLFGKWGSDKSKTAAAMFGGPSGKGKQGPHGQPGTPGTPGFGAPAPGGGIINNYSSGTKRESSPKRGSLTKAAAAGQGGRKAEMAVRGPQYDMQHRAMEQEYSGGIGYGQPQRGSPQSQSWGYQPQPGPQQQQYAGNPPRLVQQPQQQQQDESPFYYSVDMAQQQRLPPGAMAPMDQMSWPSGPSNPQQPNSAPPPHRRSRSPPPQQQGLTYHSNESAESFGEQTGVAGVAGVDGYGKQQRHHRGPGRSLSATALPSQSPSANGRPRKGVSASAALPSHRARTKSAESHGSGINGAVGEEEDMPLAMYQQQRRR
ncbi:protein that interacts with silencing proteins at the telomere [Moniliophthora roreri]|nr:protein that interacts with silencing proteins at the telomere [Moniliophthora roreri]